jgi:hypothetical protein
LSPSAAANRRFGFQVKPEITPPPIPTNPGTAPAGGLPCLPWRDNVSISRSQPDTSASARHSAAIIRTVTLLSSTARSGHRRVEQLLLQGDIASSTSTRKPSSRPHRAARTQIAWHLRHLWHARTTSPTKKIRVTPEVSSSQIDSNMRCIKLSRLYQRAAQPLVCEVNDRSASDPRHAPCSRVRCRLAQLER